MLCAIILLPAGNRLFLYFAVVSLYGIINSACYNTSMFYCGATGKNPKKNMAVHEICMALGNAAGTAGGGFFYEHIRFTGVCLILLLVLGLGLGIHVLLGRRVLAAMPEGKDATPASAPKDGA
jgi:predicted MFS family arabinose efflux permease